MRPLRLELEGFGAFREACTVDFADIELVALVGNTGAGKSTIIDAITFALYGSVARYEDNRAVAPVINQTSTRARVRLDFELGEVRYTAVRLVQRTRNGATTKEARLERGEEILAADARSMSAEITRLLGLDVDQFNRTVVLPQGRFADFLHDSPADRQSTLRQLLGLEIYQQVAAASRQRAAALRNQIDALRPELDDGDRELTPERRVALVEHHDRVATTRMAFIEALARLVELASAVAGLDARLASVRDQLTLLDGIRPPAGLAALDDRSTRADVDVERTTTALTTARDRRRRADADARDGPDLAACTTQLRQHHEADAALSELTATTAELAAAESRRVAAQVPADAVTLTQEQLDRDVGERRAVEQAARQDAEAGPNPVRVEHWIAERVRRATVATDADAAATAAAGAARDLEPIARRLRAAEEAEAEARRHRDDVQQRAGAAGLVGLLAVGAPCPLCLHEVATLPEHHVSEDLERMAQALDGAIAALTAAREEHRAAERLAGELRATAAATQGALDAIDAGLVDVADDRTLRSLLADAAARRVALDAASAARAAA
ncbi:MAG: SMC family ATPase, partial [Ilumatobacteraceae bacterium]